MTDAQLLIFMAVVTGFFLSIIIVAAIMFAKWSQREKELGRRQIDAGLAEAQRRATTKEEEESR